MNLRILLADDHGLFTAGLRRLLDLEPGIEVVGAATDGATAVTMVQALRPHVVVMDVSMPGMNGIEATRRIMAVVPGTRVLCLSMHAEKRFVTGVLAAGAAGYMLKECAAEELIGAIRAVAGGQTWLSPAIAGLVAEAWTGGSVQEGAAALALLTSREREVLQLVAEGHSVKDIAARLQVSIKTVGTHRQHVMHKLGIHNVAGLTKYAIREGLTSSSFDSTE